jgi:hypothetical protein
MVTRSRGVVAALAVFALAVTLYLTRGRRPPLPGRAPASRSAPAADQVPRIDLARLTAPRPQTRLGERDLFSFAETPGAAAAARDDEEDDSPEVAMATPPPQPVDIAPTPTPLPPLNVKFIGALESKAGLKVAVLMTERREVLTGQTGEVVANRFRIVKIGFESVDIQELGSDQVRRIPLRGN